jgi:hypothetical protein
LSLAAVSCGALLLSACVLPGGEDWIEAGSERLIDYNLQRYVPVPIAPGMQPVWTDIQDDVAIFVVWRDEDGKVLTEADFDAFAEGKMYEAEITLIARQRSVFDPETAFGYRPEWVVKEQEEIRPPEGEVRRVVNVTYMPVPGQDGSSDDSSGKEITVPLPWGPD